MRNLRTDQIVKPLLTKFHGNLGFKHHMLPGHKADVLCQFLGIGHKLRKAQQIQSALYVHKGNRKQYSNTFPPVRKWELCPAIVFHEMVRRDHLKENNLARSNVAIVLFQFLLKGNV